MAAVQGHVRSLYGYGEVSDVVAVNLGKPLADSLSATDAVVASRRAQGFHLFMHEGGDISFSAVLSGAMTYDLRVRVAPII